MGVKRRNDFNPAKLTLASLKEQEGLAIDQTSINRPLALTDNDRAVLSKKFIREADHALIPYLWEPFADAYVHLWPLESVRPNLYVSFHYCGGMMLNLDCTYWAFTWDRILRWRDEVKEIESWRPKNRKLLWDRQWSRVAAILYFMDILPYRESIYKLNHMEIARKWLGEERAMAIQERFVEVAKSIGYQYDRDIRGRGASVMFAVMVTSNKRNLEDLTKADFAAWEAQTGRSTRVASQGVTIAQRVLRAMGYLRGEAPRSSKPGTRNHFTWGRTTLALLPPSSDSSTT